ncbi:FYVE zinc finger-domain-containing protein, partial [Blastocladiella britannica]
MSGSPTSDGESPTAAIPRSPQPWVPDAQAPACHHCHKRFSWTVRRHHCRLCGNVVCGSCSRHRVDL